MRLPKLKCISSKGHITVLLRYNVLTTKTYPGGLLHDPSTFTLKSEEIQSIIEYSVRMTFLKYFNNGI